MHKTITGALISLALALLIGCKGEQGPQGPAGTEKCSTCHSDNTTILAKEIQYENSVHYLGGNFERDNYPCAGCHTHEGFITKLQGGDTTVAIIDPTPPNCRTCHNVHTTYTWDDFKLKTESPVTLRAGGGIYNQGEGNLCANCHQTRNADMIKPGQDPVNITSPYWGPHYGNMSNLLSGNSGFEEFPGTYNKQHPHYTSITDGCPQCHMAEPFGAQAGGHTMNVFYVFHGQTELLTSGCTGCHSDPETKFENLEAEIETKLDSLKKLLVNAGILNPSTDRAIPGTYSRALAGAFWNYKFVEYGKAIHNPAYARSLLDNTIANFPTLTKKRFAEK
ncbi:MAG: hypothetical protein ABIN20_05905 [candidate division WOR-3 bacterium]